MVSDFGKYYFKSYHGFYKVLTNVYELTEGQENSWDLLLFGAN